MKTLKDLLIELSACDDAIQWAGNNPIDVVVKTVHRGDWLLWLAKKIEVDKRKITLAKGYCANTVIHLMNDDRSKKAVQAAIDYGNNKINDKELSAAADDAYASYADAYAAYASASAAYAAYASSASSYAASAYAAASSYAAYAAASSYAAAAYAAANAAAAASSYAASAYAAAAVSANAAASARKTNQMATADICRVYLGDEIIKIVNSLLICS